MNQTSPSDHSSGGPKKGIPIWLIVLGTMLVTVLVTLLVVRYYFWPSPFSPTELSQKEERRLEQKIQRVIPGLSLQVVSRQALIAKL